MNEQKSQLKFDYILLFLVLLLASISIFTLYTITPFLPAKYSLINFPLKQIQWYIAGGFIIFVIMLVDYDRFQKITWIAYFVGIIPLIMIALKFPPNLIHNYNNANRGINLPVIGTLQPAEYFKVILTLTIAYVMIRHHEKYVIRNIKTDLWLLFKILMVSAPPMGLIAIQPDLGSVLVLVFITTCMILVSGISWRVISAMVASAGAAVGLLVGAWALFPGKIGTFLEETVFKHVTSRINGWLYPEEFSESGYQLIYTMRAIGSGQLFGKGISNMEVSVPEKHTDMIFTAIAEQFGFIGVSAVLIIYFILIYRLIHIAMSSNDKYGSYIVTGLVGMFTYQIFQNIGMSIQLLPITGLPLPFLSYGGSSTMTYMLAIGLILNVHSRTKEYMFETD
ncbi:MAG TPA: FtsW/RodA/SpoVE family cell cycle protein [Candidatus Dormibacteraeota bacterium]|nr:FtsW/RodA/SpoVE family cell cycle protein [Candidatus Dormibacteraeota bacterium]